MKNKGQTTIELFLVLAVSMIALSIIFSLYSEQVYQANIQRDSFIAKNSVQRLVNAANTAFYAGIDSEIMVELEIPRSVLLDESEIVGNTIILKMANGSEIVGVADINLNGFFKEQYGKYKLILNYDGNSVNFFYNDFELNQKNISFSSFPNSEYTDSVRIRNNSQETMTFFIENNFSHSFVTLDVNTESFVLSPGEIKNLDLNFLLGAGADGSYSGNVTVTSEVNGTNVSKKISISVESILEIEDLMIYPLSTSFTIYSGETIQKSFSVCNKSTYDINEITWSLMAPQDSNLLELINNLDEVISITDINSGQCENINLDFNFVDIYPKNYDCNLTAHYTNSESLDANYVSFLETNVIFDYSDSPQVEFVSPTPLDASSQEGESIDVNVFSNNNTLLDVNISTVIDFNDSLVSWWRMDDVDGTTLIDYVGDNNGTISGATQVDGKFGDALDFENNAFVEVLDSSTISPTSSVTISFWAKTTIEHTGLGLITKGPISGDYDYMVYITSAGETVQLYVKNSLGTGQSSGSGPFNTKDGLWHHYVAIFDGDWAYVYADGQLIGSRDLDIEDIRDSGNSLNIARGWGDYFDGQLDDLMVFNRALSEEEVVALYANTSSKYLGVNYTGLAIGDYSFIAYAQDTNANINSTEERNITIINPPRIYFVSPTPENDSVIENDFFDLNVFVENVLSSDENVSVVVDFNDSLVSWWRMDDVDGTTLIDYVGDNNGTISGATQVDGKLGDALDFDGDSDYVNVGQQNDLEVQTLTMAYWAKTTDYASSLNGGVAYGQIFGSIGTSAYRLEMHSGSMRSKLFFTDSDVSQLSESIGDNDWHFWVMTYDGTEHIFYKDGNEVTSNPISKTIDYTISSRFFDIGARNTGAYSLDGQIDDLLIFNRALSEDEVIGLYANTSSKYLDVNYTDLDAGEYSFTAYAQDTNGNINSTETRTVELTGFDYSNSPQVEFVSPTPLDASSQEGESIDVNVFSNNNTLLDVNVSTVIDFNNSLVGWWRMDDVSGTTLIDYVGDYNGTIGGNVVQTDEGYIGKAIEFDGSSDSVVFGGTNSAYDFTAGQAFSYGAWFNAYSFPESWHGIISKMPSWGNGYNLQVGPSQNIACGIGTYVKTAWVPQTNTWYHALCVYDGSVMTLYVDGVEEASAEYAINSGNSDLKLGMFYTTGSLPFYGAIDDVIILNRALNEDEVIGLYANTSSKYLDVNYTGLAVGDYSFTAYAQDTNGNINSTETRTVELTG